MVPLLVLTADRAGAAELPQAKNPLSKTNKKSASPYFPTEVCPLPLNWKANPQASAAGDRLLQVTGKEKTEQDPLSVGQVSLHPICWGCYF